MGINLVNSVSQRRKCFPNFDLLKKNHHKRLISAIKYGSAEAMNHGHPYFSKQDPLRAEKQSFHHKIQKLGTLLPESMNFRRLIGIGKRRLRAEIEWLS